MPFSDSYIIHFCINKQQHKSAISEFSNHATVVGAIVKFEDWNAIYSSVVGRLQNTDIQLTTFSTECVLFKLNKELSIFNLTE